MLCAPLLLLALSPVLARQEPEAPPPAPREASFPELGLELVLPPLAELRRVDREGKQVVCVWLGKLGRSDVVIQLEQLDRERMGFDEPADMLELVATDATDPAQGGALVRFEDEGCTEGPYGWVPYAARGRTLRQAENETRIDEERLFLCGLTEKQVYVLTAICTPPVAPEERKALEEFFTQGVRYSGPVRNAAWSDEEARTRFETDAPEDAARKMDKIVRTEHYIVLTNSSSGDKFGKVMEECYETIREIFPFEECGQRKLLPVFLFRDPDQYYGFTMKVTGWGEGQARGTKGHAWRDYYATWFEALNDPVHVHEATHQIFSNVLGLTGGGSWFQEGVAEYVETRKNDRNAIATQVKKGRHMPLRKFVTVRTLAFEGAGNVKGGDAAGDLYKQAALLIEFLRESKFGKERFQEFVHTMGAVQRGDAEAIERVFREIYGVDLDQLDLEFQAYCKKR